MKNRILYFVILLFMLPAFSVMAQEVKKSDTVLIKSSVVCGMCKDRIEQGLAFAKGVKMVNVDVEAKIVKVAYNPKKTDPSGIRKTVALIGYDADDVPADKDAYAGLPACCKKDQAPH